MLFTSPSVLTLVAPKFLCIVPHLAGRIRKTYSANEMSLFAYLCADVVYLCRRGICTASRVSALVWERLMKSQRHNAIRELVANSLVANQDELRRKLRRHGFEVTQATLSRDIHELRLSKGPNGYLLPKGDGAADEDNTPPTLAEMIESFGLRVRQAMNQVVVATVTGGAQPLGAALDREDWTEVVGTLAGDDTVLIICPDVRRAGEVESRLRTMLES
jgi:transcriptional regulator of arginine metabolism